MKDARQISKEEWQEQMSNWGEPAFRSDQIDQWLMQNGTSGFMEMTSLSKALCGQLQEECHLAYHQGCR